MLTAEEEAKVGALLNNGDTPTPIKDLLGLLIDCKNNLADSINRLEYLERLARAILCTPEGALETVSYMPGACPQVPYLIKTDAPSEYPIPAELQGVLYKGALELGLQLLTPMEAGAMLKGIKVGISKDEDHILPAILMVSIGQRIREQQQQQQT